MRETILLNDGWKYYDGDPAVHAPNNKGTVYMQAKTECRLWGPAAEKYDDSAFAPVTLPHDALIGRTPRPEGNEGLGYFRYHCGWYRRRFALPEREDGARAYLRFEGVATHAEVYVNGCLAGRSFGGYAPFDVDISCFARFGGKNTVSVRVDSASSYEGWWYQGMGIYRDVKLIVTNDARIASDGVFVHPEKQTETLWRVPVDVEIENHASRTRTLTVRAEILDGQGATAARGEATAQVSAWDACTVTLALNAQNPALWRLSDPELYTCRVTLHENGETLDSETARFGFRTIGFAADGAFLLNGERTYINGVNCHQDFGLTGKVMPPEIAGYRVRLMKEMGANAMRLAHYPHGEAEMNALDENGMLALAETRWFSTEPEAVKQLTALIRRDRNHPCVFLWSVGNEEPLHAEPRGRRIAEELFARVRKLDPTRPLTTVVCHAPGSAPVYDACDVLCLNYNLQAYDELHRRYPNKPFLAGEWCATPTTRGWYAPDDPEKGRVFAGDHDPHNGFSAAREDTAAFTRTRKWVAGGFQWVGVEHRGECKWPRLCSASGAVDLFLLKKDAYYQNQTLMRTEPRVHILGHWNAPANGAKTAASLGCGANASAEAVASLDCDANVPADRAEVAASLDCGANVPATGAEAVASVDSGANAADGAKTVPVWVYARADRVELFLNGVSLGIRDIRDGRHAEWQVPYTPGELRAVGYMDVPAPQAADDSSGTPEDEAPDIPKAASYPSGTPVCGASVTPCAAGNPSGTSVCGASVIPCAESNPSETPVCGTLVTPSVTGNPSGTPVCGTTITPCAAECPSGTTVCGTSNAPCAVSDPSGTPVCGTPDTPCVASYPSGTPVCEDVRHTTGAPVRLRLMPVEPGMPLFTCECLDEAGRVVPDAAPYVRFRAEGGVRIIATGSDNADPIPPAVPNRQMYMGQIAVYARVSASGALIAEADGLASARYEIKA